MFICITHGKDIPGSSKGYFTQFLSLAEAMTSLVSLKDLDSSTAPLDLMVHDLVFFPSWVCKLDKNNFSLIFLNLFVSTWMLILLSDVTLYLLLRFNNRLASHLKATPWE